MVTADDTQETSGEALLRSSIATARQWTLESWQGERPQAELNLEALLDEEGGLAFALALVDDVLRPESLHAAASALHRLAADAPEPLAWRLRSAIRIGGAMAPLLPAPVVPLSRVAVRDLFRHLLCDAKPARLAEALAALSAGGHEVEVMRPSGEIAGAQIRAERIAQVLARIEGGVPAVSFTLPEVLGRSSGWAFAEAVAGACAAMLPLCEAAVATGTAVTFAVSEHRDLDLTIAVFTQVLELDQFAHLDAGIVLQSSVPESEPALEELAAWARSRAAAGGKPIRIRVVKGSGVEAEQIAATLHGWAPACQPTKLDTDAAHLRLIERILRPDLAAAVRAEVAGHDLFDLAYAWTLAQQRGAEDRVRLLVLHGMASAQAAVLAEHTGACGVLVPIVDAGDFSPAAAYLSHRLAELASPDGALATWRRSGDDEDGLDAQEEAFRRRFARAEGGRGAAARSRQDRTREVAEAPTGRVLRAPGDDGEQGLTQEVLGIAVAAAGTDTSPIGHENAAFFGGASLVDTAVFQVRERTGQAHGAAGFRNAPDTDPDLAANRDWAENIVERVSGDAESAPAAAVGAAGIPAAIDAVAEAAAAWAELPAVDRSDVLRQVAVEFERARAELIESVMRETGSAFVGADAQVGAAVDAAAYVASTCRELDAISGARFHPDAVILVVPDPDAPVASAADLITAALAVGSGVVIAPAPNTVGTTAAMLRAIGAAGVPAELLVIIDAGDEPAVGAAHAHPHIQRVLLRGSRTSALRLREVRPEVPVLAETPGVNTILVAPSADPELAARDIVASAFADAGRDPDAASIAILVGSAGRSEQFARTLVDLTRASAANVSAGALPDPDALAAAEPLLLERGDIDDDAEVAEEADDTEVAEEVDAPEASEAVDDAGHAHRAAHAHAAADGDAIVHERTEREHGSPDGAAARDDEAAGGADDGTADLSDAVHSDIGTAADADADVDVEQHLDPGDSTGTAPRAVTTLAPGEAWLVEPVQTRAGWTPGIRAGVSGADGFAASRPNAPVLGVMYAPTFGEALRLQAQIGAGSIAGLYSHDPLELEQWLHDTHAGTLVVNRPTVGAKVQRQPRGGWDRSSLDAPGMSGGPNRLLRLGRWRAANAGSSSTLHLRGLDSRVTALVEAAQPALDYVAFDWVRRAALSDAVVWDREYGQVQDVSGLGVERNLFRYRRVPVAIRATEGAALSHLLRVVIAAVRAGSEITVSATEGMPSAVRYALGEQNVTVFVEHDGEWLARLSASGVPRARVFGDGAAAAAAAAAAAMPELAVFSDEVTTAGRVELLPFLREQSISITAHRFGMPDNWSARVI